MIEIIDVVILGKQKKTQQNEPKKIKTRVYIKIAIYRSYSAINEMRSPTVRAKWIFPLFQMTNTVR